MHAVKLSPDYWQVTDGQKWYTVRFRGAIKPWIENHKSIWIKPDGALGRKVLAAVNEVRHKTGEIDG